LALNRIGSAQISISLPNRNFEKPLFEIVGLVFLFPKCIGITSKSVEKYGSSILLHRTLKFPRELELNSTPE